MPNRFQIKRTTTSGLLPNVSNSSNTTYIAAGELAINLTDRKLLSSNGSATFEVGANLASIVVGTAFTQTSGNANFDSGVLFVDGTNNKVGIGTTSPVTSLEVKGTGFVASSISGDSTSETQLRFFTNTGARISQQANQALIFDTNATERMRIEYNGSVGIARVPDTSFALDVGGEVRIINEVGGGFGGAFRLYNSSAGATNPAKHFRIGSTGNWEIINSAYNAVITALDDSGNFYAGTSSQAPIFYDSQNTDYYLDPNNTGTALNVAGSIVAAGNVVAPTLRTSANTALTLALQTGTAFNTGGSAIALRGSTTGYNDNGMEFYAGNSERMRIDGSGNVGIGNASPAHTLSVTGTTNLGGAVTGITTLAAGNTSITGFITATGDITAFFSDDRLKDRYSNIPNAVEKVKSLNGFYYEPNITAQDLGYQKEMHVGVSAQEVNAIIPEIVAPAPIDNKYMTVKYDRLIPLLIEAIKEQQIQIDELKAQLKKD